MKKILFIVLGILFIITGGVLIFNPIFSFAQMGYVFAAVILMSGIASVIIWFKARKELELSVWNLVLSIISIVFAIAIFSDIFFKIAFETFLIYLIASYFLLFGVLKIVLAFKTRFLYKTGAFPEGKNWWLLLLLGILNIICAGITFSNPIIMVLVIGINIALGIMMSGIDLITMAFISTEIEN